MKSFKCIVPIFILSTAFSVDAFTTPAHHISSVSYGNSMFQTPSQRTGRNIVNNLTVKEVQDEGKVNKLHVIFFPLIF
jgi:hypothetical protein